jgi:hypothetical protein
MQRHTTRSKAASSNQPGGDHASHIYRQTLGVFAYCLCAAIGRLKQAAERRIVHRANPRSTQFQLPRPLAGADRPSIPAI